MDNDRNSQTPSAGHSQNSTGNTPQTASGSSATPQGSGSRETTRSSTTRLASSRESAQNSKRRRGLGVVTPNACTECRKKRAKCDGNKPCGRCKSQKDIECVYEIPVRQSKENLRSEIEQLRHRQRSNEQIFAALVRPKLWEDVLSRLRAGQSVESISEWLASIGPSGASAARALTQQHGERNFANRQGRSPTRDAGAGSTSAHAVLAPMGMGVSAMSPVAPLPSGMRTEMGQTSPWPYSSHSQGGSSRSNSIAEPMNWTPDIRETPTTQGGYWSRHMRPEHMSETMPRYRGLEHILSPLTENEMQSPSGTWTGLTADINLVHHLLALYFCWEYPTFASLSKEHFLRDFQNGRNRYCSPILVNALLALGCRFSTQPMTRANPRDPYSSGNHFFKEALRLFNDENDHHSLTTIQALGIMSIREASCGRDSESWYYAGQSQRLAIEMGLNRITADGDEDELAVQSATFWGAFALDHAWSLATGSVPQCSFQPHLPTKPGIIADIEASLWVPYTDDGAPLQRACEQPSNVRSVYRCFCELSELVHQSLYLLHSPGKPLTSRVLLNLYTQYLNWYDRIPEVLRLGHNFTPAVLFAHMYYHFAILLLFRPLIRLRIIGSTVLPRDVCLQAADAIQRLLTSYSQLYTLRLTPSFVPYFVLTATIMHIAVGTTEVQTTPGASGLEKMQEAAHIEPHVAKALCQGIADLTEMVPCHHFAEQALNILKSLAKKWDINVDMDVGNVPTAGSEDIVRPYDSSLNFFAPNVVAEDFVGRWGTGNMVANPKSVSTLDRIQRAADSVENVMLWPFPLQGRPRLPSGEELEKFGFAML